MRFSAIANSAIAVFTAVALTLLLLWVSETVQQRQQTLEHQQNVINQQRAQIEAVRGAQECVIRLLLVEPTDRGGFKVGQILDSCPDALPQRDTQGSLPPPP